MLGFRNIAIHNYREINLDILESIITERLDDFRGFTQALLKGRPFAEGTSSDK